MTSRISLIAITCTALAFGCHGKRAGSETRASDDAATAMPKLPDAPVGPAMPAVLGKSSDLPALFAPIELWMTRAQATAAASPAWNRVIPARPEAGHTWSLPLEGGDRAMVSFARRGETDRVRSFAIMLDAPGLVRTLNAAWGPPAARGKSFDDELTCWRSGASIQVCHESGSYMVGNVNQQLVYARVGTVATVLGAGSITSLASAAKALAGTWSAVQAQFPDAYEDRVGTEGKPWLVVDLPPTAAKLSWVPDSLVLRFDGAQARDGVVEAVVYTFEVAESGAVTELEANVRRVVAALGVAGIATEVRRSNEGVQLVVTRN